VSGRRHEIAEALQNNQVIIVSGETGSGKTTLLNVLSSFIPDDERIVTIEDTAELQLQQKHVARMETRPANLEGKGEITMRDLVKNSLRQYCTMFLSLSWMRELPLIQLLP